MWLEKGNRDLNKEKFIEICKSRKIKESEIDYAFNEFQLLNNALFDGKDVFAICYKQPRNLDSGKHHFQIHYINENNRITKFWNINFMDKWSNGDYSYSFSSRVIGMSRLLDATDNIFGILQLCGGCYAQIDCLN